MSRPATHADKLKLIRSFVKIKIKNSSKKLTPSEKGQITRNYNKLEKMGYLNKQREGYILKDISRSKYKIKGMPNLKKVYIDVGTRIIGGEVVTDTRSKVEIKNGKISVLRGGKLRRWEFNYNASREMPRDKFRKHIKKNMGQDKLKRGQYVVAGAGMYEMSFTATDNLDSLADEINKMRNQYAQDYRQGLRKSKPSDFMGRIIVYEGKDAIRNSIISKNRLKSKKKNKRSRIKGR